MIKIDERMPPLVYFFAPQTIRVNRITSEWQTGNSGDAY